MNQMQPQPQTSQQPRTPQVHPAKTINTPYGTALVTFIKYHDGNNAVRLVDPVTGEPIATMSVSLDTGPMPRDCVYIKTWSENEPLVAPLLASGLFYDTGTRVAVGPYDAVAQLWTIKHLSEAA